jgi:hypothetical protein
MNVGMFLYGVLKCDRLWDKMESKTGSGWECIEFDVRLSTLEPSLTSEQNRIATRPVSREFNSQMKIYDQLMGGILDQVLEDIEEERVRQGRKRIVLNSTLPYSKIIEGMNKTWEKR